MTGQFLWIILCSSSKAKKKEVNVISDVWFSADHYEDFKPRYVLVHLLIKPYRSLVQRRSVCWFSATNIQILTWISVQSGCGLSCLRGHTENLRLHESKQDVWLFLFFLYVVPSNPSSDAIQCKKPSCQAFFFFKNEKESNRTSYLFRFK